MDLTKIIDMDNHRLLASAALFRGMYSEDLDQYDILAKFIQACVNINHLYSLDSTECTSLLKKDFGFEIPEAVVRNCIKSKLKKQFERIVGTPQWRRTTEFSPDPTLLTSFNDIQRDHEKLKNQLIEHVELQVARTLSSDEQTKLIDDFHAHLTGAPRQNKNFPYIGHFILAVETTAPARKILDHTKQGLIIFDGLRFSIQNSGGHLPSDLTIFLDTEVLFSAAGYNGELRKKLFNDFLSLSTELNSRAKKGNGKIIFRYFDDTFREIENYFDTAESIANRRSTPEPNKQAMMHIVNGCSNGADVIAKRTRFFNDLSKLKILPAANKNYYDPPGYNIESLTSVDDLSKEINCEKDKASQILSHFSKINFLRKGDSRTYLEAVQFIFLSEKNNIRLAAFSDTVAKLSNGNIPFSTDLDYMTERLWFKLNRGFGNNTLIPVAFDLVTRTQIVLASQLSGKVTAEYNQLVLEHKDVNTGMSDELLGQFIVELMAKIRQPEELNKDNLDLDFLVGNDFAAHAAAEYSALKIAAEEGKRAKQTLDELKTVNGEQIKDLALTIDSMQKVQDDLRKAQKFKELRAKRHKKNGFHFKISLYTLNTLKFLYWAIPISTFSAVIYFLKSSSDTWLSLFGTYFTVLPVVVSITLFVFKGKFEQTIVRTRKNYLLRNFLRIGSRKRNPK